MNSQEAVVSLDIAANDGWVRTGVYNTETGEWQRLTTDLFRPPSVTHVEGPGQGFYTGTDPIKGYDPTRRLAGSKPHCAPCPYKQPAKRPL
jgi:hypothetical protein